MRLVEAMQAAADVKMAEASGASNQNAGDQASRPFIFVNITRLFT